jgi:hypothetical protein
MRKARLHLMVLAGMALAGALYAAPIAVENPSFETPVLAEGAYDQYSAGQTKYGWTQSGGAATTYSYIVHPGVGFDYLPLPVPDGVNTMVMRRSGTGIQQSQTLGTVAAGEYTVDISVAGLNTVAVANYAVCIYDLTDAAYIGGVTDSQDWVDTYGLDLGSSAVTGSWTGLSFNITAPAGHDLMLAFAPVTDGFVAFDDISITPEPATMGLLVFGGVLALYRRRHA